MAIVEMLHVQLLGMRKDKARLLRAMQKVGCLEISEIDQGPQGFQPKDTHGKADADNQLAKIRWAIMELGRHSKGKQGLLTSFSMPEASEAEFQEAAAQEEALLAIIANLEANEKRRGDLRSTEARLRAKIEQLLPWRAFTLPLDRFHDTAETFQMVGSISSQMFDSLGAALLGHAVTINAIHEERNITNLWIIAHHSERDDLMEALGQANFAEASFPAYEGTVAQQIDEANQALYALQAERDAMDGQAAQLAEKLPQIKILYEVISARLDRENMETRLLETKEAFLLTGWLPADEKERLESSLRKVSESISLAVREANENEQPPVLLHNNRFATPFESIVASFSLPDPRGMDPTFVMAPFFLCFFGMMLSDAGYGLIMAIGMPLAIRLLRPRTGMRRMMIILGLGGAVTIFWGAMFDTWFGMSLKPMLVNPLEDPLKMMAICLGSGAVHLFAGVFVGVYKNIRRGKPLDAVYDQFSWFFLIVGLGLLLLPSVASIGKWMAIISATVIALTAARDKKNWLSRIMGGLGALYGITGWLSDLLSYMRLFGMGLATGVIGVVINQLTGLMFGKNIVLDLVGVAILIAGHMFNIIINTIGAYVHASRLQYIEFFSKFYEDGGRSFAPLAHHPRYVAIRDSNADHVQL